MKVSNRASTPKKSKSSTRARTSVARGKARLWKSILVPTDFSASSFKALEYAFTLGELFGSKITLAHVVVPVAAPDLVYGPIAWDESIAIDTAKEKLNELKQEKGVDAASRVRIVVRQGHPYTEIDQIAKDIQADLIVVSTHGRSGLRHLLLGSVAERVIRHAPCPVLVVRENEHEFVK
jgi:nucleotide-binding universal stress UspA family protein